MQLEGEMFDLDDDWMNDDPEQVARDEEIAKAMAEVDAIERLFGVA